MNDFLREFTFSELISEALLRVEMQEFADGSRPTRNNGIDKWETMTEDYIMEQERKMTEIAVALRTKYNSAKPINRLPSEMISLIFKRAQGHERLDNYIRDSRPGDAVRANSWVRLTHVCRHWRNVAQMFPELWTYLVVPTTGSQDSYIPYFLKLSGSLPLNIYQVFDFYSFRRSMRSGPMLPGLESKRNRIRELHFHQSGYLKSGIWHHLKFSAPSLYSLTLDLTPGAHGFPPERLPLLFAGRIPSLKRIDLANVTRWHNEFHDLTHITLRDQQHALRVPLKEFLCFLSASPRLQTLKLIDAGPDMSSVGDIHLEDVIILPDLRVLEIGTSSRTSIPEIQLLVAHIDLSSDCVCSYWGRSMFYGAHPIDVIAHQTIQTINLWRGSDTHKWDEITFEGTTLTVRAHSPFPHAFPSLESISSSVTTLNLYADPSTPGDPGWDIIHILEAFESLEVLNVGVAMDYYPLKEYLQSPRSSRLRLEKLIVQPYTDIIGIPGPHREWMDGIRAAGAYTLARPPPCRPTCQIVIDCEASIG